MMRVKRGRYGARLDPSSAKAVFFVILKECMDKHGFTLYEITSGLEGKHVPGSKHYYGSAWDITVRRGGPKANLGQRWKELIEELRHNLADDFQIVDYYPEAVRLHAEFDPQRPFGKL